MAKLPKQCQFQSHHLNLPVILIESAIHMDPCLLMMADSWHLAHHPFELKFAGSSCALLFSIQSKLDSFISMFLHSSLYSFSHFKASRTAVFLIVNFSLAISPPSCKYFLTTLTN